MGLMVADHDRETHGKSLALGCLNDAIDSTRDMAYRKALAADLGKSESTFSKMTNGLQAFGLDDFEQLPRDLQVKWMKRYGKDVLGLNVYEMDQAAIADELLQAIDRIQGLAKLARLGKATPAKAELPYQGAERRRA